MASIRWTRASSIRLRSRRYRNESATGQDPHPIDRAWSSPGSRFLDPTGAPREAFLELALAMGLESRRRAGVESDRAARGPGPRLAVANAGADHRRHLHDVDAPGFEVNGGPSEPDELAPAHPCHGRQAPEGSQAVGVGRDQARAQLLGARCPGFRRRGLRRLREVRDVAGEQVPPASVGERPMNDAVQVVNRRRRERSGYATTAALDRRQLSRHHRQADADRIPDRAPCRRRSAAIKLASDTDRVYAPALARLAGARERGAALWLPRSKSKR